MERLKHAESTEWAVGYHEVRRELNGPPGRARKSATNIREQARLEAERGERRQYNTSSRSRSQKVRSQKDVEDGQTVETTTSSAPKKSRRLAVTEKGRTYVDKRTAGQTRARGVANRGSRGHKVPQALELRRKMKTTS